MFSTRGGLICSHGNNDKDFTNDKLIFLDKEQIADECLNTTYETASSNQKNWIKELESFLEDK